MIADNLVRVCESIEAAKIRHGSHENIQLIAVSKYSKSAEIVEAFKCGQISFGENKVQDLIQKKHELQSCDIEWHFIGTLQENKINALLNAQPTLLHSLHSLKLAYALQKRLVRDNLTLNALLQVNSANEDSKSGFSCESALSAYLEILQECPNIKLQGLMCMGAHTDDVNLIEKGFRQTRNIYEQLQSQNAHILSMGMSSDYEIAIACGSNCVRIGSSIFKG